ncbi:MAG: TRAP transporter large permease subunit [Burkholderiaceae bacterium]|nr:TRAP transporter large permease subunit [Burkholderiaceae bacterium]MEB2317529.1 TRAP transporter large permease subunit [Pseudomonadota bacterium]
MSSIQIAFLALAGMLALMAIRVPIAISLGLAAFCGMGALLGFSAAFRLLGSAPFEFGASWELSAVPLFLLMGNLAYRGGLTSSLFKAARLWLSRLPGGLAVAANFASAIFAAASGSSMATAAAMGRLAIPEMLKYRYDPGLATATVAAAGTLGAVIPPSIMFVLFGWYTETPIGKLLIAGIIPGILMAGMFAAYIIVRSIVQPDCAPPPDDAPTWRERFEVLLEVWPSPLLILSVIGGIYSGLTTATEAAAFGAFAALVIALVKGGLSWESLRVCLVDTLHATASLFLIAISAVILTRFLAIAGIPDFMGGLVVDMNLGPYGVILFMVIMYVILGCFLDPIGIMLITLPILMPMWAAVDLDLIWMGVLVVILLEVGLITPPVGLNAFVIKSVIGEQVSLTAIFRGLLWFVLMDLIVIAILVAFPEISTFLPAFVEH